MANRSKHIGFVVEPEISEKLKTIAKSEYRSLSSLLYRIVKNWLKKNPTK